MSAVTLVALFMQQLTQATLHTTVSMIIVTDWRFCMQLRQPHKCRTLLVGM